MVGVPAATMTPPQRSETPPGPPSAGVPAPDAHAQRHGALSRAVQATSLMTLGSRIGGLVRDVLIGRVFGDVGFIGSAFAFAFAFPNMFRRLFGEGALSAAFLPEYTDAVKTAERGTPGPVGGGGVAQADQLASLTMCMLGIVTAAITAAIELVILAVLILTPHDEARALSLKLVMVMLPFMPLICIVAIQAAMLQVHGRYGPAASGPLILNAFIIAVGLWSMFTGWAGGEITAYALGAATVLSGVTQMFWFSRLLRTRFTFTRNWQGVRVRAGRMMRKFVPVAIGLGTLQLNAFLDNLIAMWPIWVGATIFGRAYPLDTISNLILSLTTRLYQFPLGVFGIAIATAAFPLLARHAREPDHFTDTLRRGMRLSLFIGLPASIGLVLIREDVTALLFGSGRGAWSDESLLRSASVLLGFSVGIWAYSLNHVFTRAFYAQQDTATPMKVSIAVMLLNIALNLTLMWPMREAGLAWATSIAAMVQCVVLAVLSGRLLDRLHDTAGMPRQRLLDRATIHAFARIALAGAIMGGVVLAAAHVLPTRSSWPMRLFAVAVMSGSGGLTYLGAARALRLHELRWLLRRG